MKRVVFIGAWLAAGVLGAAPAHATELDAARERFDAAVLVANLNAMEKVKVLEIQYLAALSNLLGRVQNAGDLDAFEAVTRERNRFAGDRKVTRELAEASFPDLKKLQLAYIDRQRLGEQEKTQAVRGIILKYDAELASLQSSLTKQGRIEDATRVREERKQVKERPELRDTAVDKTASPETAQPAPAVPTTPERRIKCKLYWSCADVADVYLNGKPLRDYTPDFRSRPDEANREFTAEARVAKGDIITVGARRGGSFGFLMVIVDEKGKTVFRTDRKNWRLYQPKDSKQWHQPSSAATARKSPVSVQPAPWAPQRVIREKFDGKAESIWDREEKTAFLFATVE